MSIHAEHPFAAPDGERDPLRRLRGRLPQAVTVWTTGEGPGREGWTLSSVLLADGRPAQVVGLLDPDSDLAEELAVGTPVTVNLLAEHQHGVAEAFARLAPSPGGPFRTGRWQPGSHGPRLEEAAGWVAGTVLTLRPGVGWSTMVRLEVADLGLDPGRDVLVHHRGRYGRGGLGPG